MAISHFSKVFAVSDAKVAEMLTDPDGGTATYDTSIDVPGIKNVKVSGDIITKDLRGDNGPMDSDAVLGNVTIAVDHAKVSLDVLAMMFGDTVSETGTTPDQIASWDLSLTSKPTPFKLSAVSATSDIVGGNISYVFHKVVLSKFPDLGLVEEDYAIVSFEAKCSPTLATGRKIMSVASNETALALT